MDTIYILILIAIALGIYYFNQQKETYTFIVPMKPAMPVVQLKPCNQRALGRGCVS
jgi:hypothetical protein